MGLGFFFTADTELLTLMSDKMKYNFSLKLFNILYALVRTALVFFILLTILGVMAPYTKNLNNYTYLQPAVSFEKKINLTVKNAIPTQIAGKDASRLITIIALLVLLEMLNGLADRVTYQLHKKSMENEVVHLKKSFSPQAKETISVIENQMELVKLSRGKDRKKLLKEFAHIKRELEKHGRDMAFLAVDVVDSTGLKAGEDSASVQHDFHEYQDFIQAKFKEFGYITATWTPDGVMACFNTIQNAVEAGQAIINGLPYFNSHVKLIKKEFQVRCGVNGGFVYYDGSIPLENFSDRTIDIAGHMQKHAPPNTLFIAKQMIEPVLSRANFRASERVVDGLEVFEWRR